MKQISEEEYKDLIKHSQMLGIIGMYVEDFCLENDTVLTGVMRLLADYYSLRSEELHTKIQESTSSCN